MHDNFVSFRKLAHLKQLIWRIYFTIDLQSEKKQQIWLENSYIGVQIYERFAFSYNQFGYEKRGGGDRNKTLIFKWTWDGVNVRDNPSLKPRNSGVLYQNRPWHLHVLFMAISSSAQFDKHNSINWPDLN